MFFHSTYFISARYSLTYYATVWLGGSDDIYEGFYSWVDGNLLSRNQSEAIGTGEQYHLALVKPSYQLTKTKTTLGYSLCQITKGKINSNHLLDRFWSPLSENKAFQ